MSDTPTPPPVPPADSPAADEVRPSDARPESGAPGAADERTAARSRPGQARALAVVFVLWLLTFAGAGAAAWVYLWQPLQGRLADLDAAMARNGDEIGALTQALGTVRGQAEAQSVALESTRRTLARLESHMAGNVAAWRLAEAEYLLRSAAQSARLRQAPALVLAALEGADTALAATGDPSFVPVREAIAVARARVEAVEAPDVVGTRLELRAQALVLADLPLRSEPGQAGPVSLPAAPTWRDRLAQLVREVFVWRRVDGAGALGPDGPALLRGVLELRVLQAELALEQRDSQAWRLHLADLDRLLVLGWGEDVPAVTEVRARLRALADLELAPEQAGVAVPLQRLQAELERRARNPDPA